MSMEKEKEAMEDKRGEINKNEVALTSIGHGF